MTFVYFATRFFIIALCLSALMFLPANGETFSYYENGWSSSHYASSGGIGLLSQSFVDRFFANPALLADDVTNSRAEWFSLGVHSTLGENLKPSELHGSRQFGAIAALQSRHWVFVPHQINSPTDKYNAVGFGYVTSLSTEFDVAIAVRPGFRERKTLETNTVTRTAYLPVDFGMVYHISPVSKFSWMAADVAHSNAVSIGALTQIYKKARTIVEVETELQDLIHMQTGMDDLLIRWQWAAHYRYQTRNGSRTIIGANAGLQSAYPSFGLWTDLFLTRFGVAYYSQEQGSRLLQSPKRSVVFNISSVAKF